MQTGFRGPDRDSDRLTRLSNSDWMTLKKQIEHHELRIVSLDVPTSWQALSDKDPSQADPITRAVITAINKHAYRPDGRDVA
ncbi:Uncharacterised protein [Hafnia alvei]|uniref:Uncharacterized protein n=1 Tax=Hafnia alvei TaxID=569 RepID=A0A377TFN9_HAFAL|nr:Uncharacterised protein [Hafnia alvei]